MNLYHVVNHGVEGRNLFLDSGDYARFVHDLFEFNDMAPVLNSGRIATLNGLRNQSFGTDRERIVDIHAWCLMRDHYHILVSERVDGGLTKFLRKLNVGYANYVNDRYARRGTLFRGRTKKVLIERQAHFLYVVHYIHFNPLDYLRTANKWRSGTVGSQAEALKHLHAYKWSSYLDYIGTKNFPSVLATSLYTDVYPRYQDAATEYLASLEEDNLLPLELRCES